MKRNNLAFLILLTLGLNSMLSLSIFGQDIEKEVKETTKACTPTIYVLPTTVSVGNKAFENYIKVMSLPSGKRQKAFSDLSNEDKAGLYKVKLALQFIKNHDLRKEQKDLILDTISNISAETYSNSEAAEKEANDLQEKALAVFPADQAYNIFATINGDTTYEIGILNKYETTISFPKMGARRTYFRNSSLIEKSEIWRTQMVFHLATSKLNKAQQNLILEIIYLSTPKAFELPEVENGVKNLDAIALDALETKAFELFSKEEVFALFMSFGSHKILPIPPKEKDSQNELVDSSCDCNWWCGALCVFCEGTSCARTRSGCGWSGRSACGGRCASGPSPNCP